MIGYWFALMAVSYYAICLFFGFYDCRENVGCAMTATSGCQPVAKRLLNVVPNMKPPDPHLIVSGAIRLILSPAS